MVSALYETGIKTCV